jgi:hypothetical protein
MEATTSGESMVQENRKEDRVRESEQGTGVRELEQENSLSGGRVTF